MPGIVNAGVGLVKSRGHGWKIRKICEKEALGGEEDKDARGKHPRKSFAEKGGHGIKPDRGATKRKRPLPQRGQREKGKTLTPAPSYVLKRVELAA